MVVIVRFALNGAVELEHGVDTDFPDSLWDRSPLGTDGDFALVFVAAQFALDGDMNEIFALTWGRLTATYADIRQRVYRGTIDTPKTDNSMRKAALSEGLLAEIERWRMMAVDTRDDAWVFPSERMTPLSKDNLLAAVDVSAAGEGRSRLGEFSGDAPDPRNLNEGARGGRKAGRRSAWTHARRKPECLYAVARRKPVGACEPVGEKPAGGLNGVQTVFRMKPGFVSRSKDGAGDGTRTRDVQLGNPAVF